MKKTKKFTQAELDSAVRMARREGIHEGRLIEKRSEETKEKA